MTQSRVSGVAVFLSFAMAAVLELLVMPQVLLAYRPEWMVLTLIYWLLRHPERIGLLSAFLIGMLMDVLSSTYLGVHIIACCSHISCFVSVCVYIICQHRAADSFGWARDKAI